MKVRRPLLLPLVPVYWLADRLRAQLYRVGAAPVRWLKNPVISVGSLSAGGAGKTPVVLLLAELLYAQRYNVSVLTRGYGRKAANIDRVDPAGSASEFGDEPLLMARRFLALEAGGTRQTRGECSQLKPAVYVGADRYLAGKLAESGHREDVELFHLLDDGFQHRRLGRDVEILVLTAAELEECLLPAGNLREPLSALARADIVILREEEFAERTPRVARLLEGLCRRKPGVHCWTIRRSLVFDDPAGLPARPFVFCAIARPEGFHELLRHSGIAEVGAKDFPDHYALPKSAVASLVRQAQGVQADGFIVTEKDFVKLSPTDLAELERVGPVVVARLRVELLNPEAALRDLMSLIDRGNLMREDGSSPARVR